MFFVFLFTGVVPIMLSDTRQTVGLQDVPALLFE